MVLASVMSGYRREVELLVNQEGTLESWREIMLGIVTKDLTKMLFKYLELWAGSSQSLATCCGNLEENAESRAADNGGLGCDV